MDCPTNEWDQRLSILLHQWMKFPLGSLNEYSLCLPCCHSRRRKCGASKRKVKSDDRSGLSVWERATSMTRFLVSRHGAYIQHMLNRHCDNERQNNSPCTPLFSIHKISCLCIASFTSNTTDHHSVWLDRMAARRTRGDALVAICSQPSTFTRSIHEHNLQGGSIL